MREAVVASLVAAAAAVTGCGSGTAPAHHPANRTATPAPHPARASAAGHSRYVDAAESEGVRVVRPPARLGVNATRLVALLPGSFRVGKPRKATVGEVDVGARIPPAGVSVQVTNAAMECGAPFLALPGHGYRVRCTITAQRRGRVEVTLIEHNARTGAAGSRFTEHAPAR